MIIEHDSSSDLPNEAARDASLRLRLDDVRQDMAAIFGPGAGQPDLAPRLAQPVRKGGAAQKGSQRRAAAGPIACAALGGLLLGMAAIAAPGLIHRMTAEPRASQPATTVAESPFEATAIAAPSLPPAPQPSAAPAVHPVAASAAVPATALATKKTAPPRPVAQSKEVRAAADPAPRGTQCQGDRLERHWCMRHDILEADRDLRLAYAKAISEGVERRFLVAHQRRWSRLRDRASRNPDAVLAGYRELAEDLERLAVNGRRRDRIS